jgi:hypothetical protein
MSSIQTTVVDMPDYEILKPGIKKSGHLAFALMLPEID